MLNPCSFGCRCGQSLCLRLFCYYCINRPPEGETLQVRRVPKGKFKQFLAVVYFRFEIFNLFVLIIK